MTVVGEKTQQELLGISCLSLEEITPPKQTITVSRSFGTMIEDFNTIAEAVVQYNVFDPMNSNDRKKHDILMRVIDMINNRYGRNTIFLGSQGDGRKWKNRQEKLCPCYTTRLSDLPIAG